jgi:hypothetical protein
MKVVFEGSRMKDFFLYHMVLVFLPEIALSRNHVQEVAQFAFDCCWRFHVPPVRNLQD